MKRILTFVCLGVLCVLSRPISAADALPQLAHILHESDDAQLQLDILRGLSAALKGRRTAPMPAGWNTAIAETFLKKSTQASGGGTLGNELAQKGIKVVSLEAGARHEYDDFVNDEWASFSQLSWSDARSASGSWRVAAAASAGTGARAGRGAGDGCRSRALEADRGDASSR